MESTSMQLYDIASILIFQVNGDSIKGSNCAIFILSPFLVGPTLKQENFPLHGKKSFLKVFNNQKADDKIFVCKFSKHVKSKLYYIENSKTRGQTV